MEAVNGWLRRAAARAERAPGLEEALIGGRFGRYVFHRLRFFAARTALAAALHAVRILLAYRLFSLRDFGLVLAAEAAAALLTSFWWGALELMREDVRESFAAGKPRRAEARIKAALGRSLRLALPIAAVGAVGPLVRLSATGSAGPSDLFLLAILARLAADLVLRCYHSGVYAVRRVYRPFWSLAGLEVLAFGGGLALWPFLGTWALPAASLLSAATSGALSYAYSARAYKHLGIRPRITLSRPASRQKARPRFVGWESGLAFTLMRLDGVVLLALLAASRKGLSAAAASILVISPIIRAGFDWTQLFYFDLKRLDVPLLRRLGDDFERRLLAISLPIGAAAWLGAMILAAVFLGHIRFEVAAAGAAFFLLRSLASVLEMRAYAGGSYSRIFTAGLFLLSGAVVAGFLLRNAVQAASAAGAGLLGASLWLALGSKSRGARRAWRLKTVRALPDWALALRRIRNPVSIGRARFSPGSPHRGLDEPDRWREEDRWAHRRIAEEASRRLGPAGETTCGGKAQIIWFAAPPDRVPDRRRLLAEGMGLLERIEEAGPFASGPEAAAWLAKSGWLGPKTGPGGDTVLQNTEEWTSHFLSFFPAGWVRGPGRRRPDGWRLLPAEDRRAIWREALAFSAGESPRPGGSPGGTAPLEGGSIGLVFAAPAGSPAPRLRSWRSFIRRRNLESLLR